MAQISGDSKWRPVGLLVTGGRRELCVGSSCMPNERPRDKLGAVSETFYVEQGVTRLAVVIEDCFQFVAHRFAPSVRRLWKNYVSCYL